MRSLCKSLVNTSILAQLFAFSYFKLITRLTSCLQLFTFTFTVHYFVCLAVYVSIGYPALHN